MEHGPRQARGRAGRVFVGVWEISNMVFTVADALRSGGYEVETLVIDTPFNRFYRDNAYDDRVRWPRGDRIYRAPVDRTRFNIEMARRFARALRRFDTFVFIWRYSFLPFQLDLVLLRLLRKNVVVFFCGDDVRYKPIQVELDRSHLARPWWPEHDPEAMRRWLAWGRSFSEALWTVKLAEKTGCRIVGTRDSATFQGRPYSGFMMPQRILAPAARRAADVPLVLHAPTDRQVKGTREVERAVEMLREEGVRFEFKLVEGMRAEDLDELLLRADILIDQPGVWPGRLGVTAMAAGCVVVGGNQAQYWHLPAPSPVVQFERDAEHLAGTLRDLMLDRDRRSALMAASLEFARRHYSYDSFVAWFEEVLREAAYPFEPLPQQKRTVRRLAETPLRKLAISLFW